MAAVAHVNFRAIGKLLDYLFFDQKISLKKQNMGLKTFFLAESKPVRQKYL